MPTNVAIKYASLPNGHIYFYQHWIPQNPKALVLFVHGLGDHIGRYSELVSRFTDDGYAFALYDQRGHGRSDGRRGHIANFSELVDDLANFVAFSRAAVPPDTPLFLICAGLGTLVSLNYLLKHEVPIDGVIAISSLIKPVVQMPQWKRRLFAKFAGIAPWLTITNDASLTESDSLVHNRLSLRAALEIEHNLELVMAMPHRIHTPMLILAGSDDRIYDPEGSERFELRLSSTDKRCIVYPEMGHDLLHERSKPDVLNDIKGWIDLRAVSSRHDDKQYPLEGRKTVWEDVSSHA